MTVVGHVPRRISAICYVFFGKPGANITCTVTGSRRYLRDLPQGGMEILCIMRFTGDKTTVRKAFTLLNEKGKPFTDSADSVPSSAYSCTGVSSNSNVKSHQQLQQSVAAEVTAEIRNDSDDSASISICVSQAQIMPKDTAIIQSQETYQLQVKTIPTACKMACKEELSTGTGEETSASAKLSMKNLKYDAKACLTMILSEPQESITKCEEGTNLASSSYTWVNFERLSLSFSDRDVIVDGLQLSDKHINFAQKIIKCQFSLQGLQSTLLQTTSKPSVNELQIVNSRGNHWIVASTLISKPNSVSVYDSLHDSLDEENIQYLFGVEEVCVVPVQKQQGYNDCGLFAIAYAVHLAKKRNPEMVYFFNHR